MNVGSDTSGPHPRSSRVVKEVLTVDGAVVAEWLSSWLAEQKVRGSIRRLAT